MWKTIAQTLGLAAGLVQVQLHPAGYQREYIAHLLETGLEQEVRVTAVTLHAEDVEIWLWVAQRAGTLGGDGEAIAAVLAERCRQGHWAERGITLVDLQFAVQIRVRRVADIGDDALDVPRLGPQADATRYLEAAVPSALDGLDDALVLQLHVACGPRGH